MFLIIILIIIVIILLLIMQKYKVSTAQIVPNHLGQEIEINEIYLSKMVQERFHNLHTKRLTRDEFKHIIDLQNDEQNKMFLNYMYDRYYGCDTIDMSYIPFATLIEEASNYSGYRLDV